MSRIQRYWLLWTAALLLVALLLYVLSPMLTPFLLGVVLAYVLQPLVTKMHQRLRMPRWLTAFVCVTVFMLVVICLLLLIAPILNQTLPLLRDMLPQLLRQVSNQLNSLLGQFGIHFQLDIESIRGLLLETMNANGQDLLQTVWRSLHQGSSSLLALAGNVFLAPVIAFFLLCDWQHIIERIQGLLPPKWLPSVSSFWADVDAALGQYLHGQSLVIVSLMVYYSLTLELSGMQQWLPLGILSGASVFVPYLGFAVVSLLALVTALTQFGLLQAILTVGIIYGAGQLLESLVLTPRMVGKSIGLHPLAVIFALLAFGQLAGFAGVLMALPVSAVLLVALRRLRTAYMQSDLYKL